MRRKALRQKSKDSFRIYSKIAGSLPNYCHTASCQEDTNENARRKRKPKQVEGRTMAKRSKAMQEAVDEVNQRNMLSVCSAEVRDGWNTLLSSMLMRANCYKGFAYLTADEVPEGHLPGIISTEVTQEDGTTKLQHTFPDHTRIAYL